MFQFFYFEMLAGMEKAELKRETKEQKKKPHQLCRDLSFFNATYQKAYQLPQKPLSTFSLPVMTFPRSAPLTMGKKEAGNLFIISGMHPIQDI